MSKKITITDKDMEILYKMLILASQKRVIREAKFLEINTEETSNACFEYENFMFEKFGIFLHDNHLSEENKAKLEETK